MSTYQINETEDNIFVIFVQDGKILTADSNTNPRAYDIAERLTGDDLEGIEDLFSLAGAVAASFENLTERVTVDRENGRVLFDGDPLPEVIEDLILRSLDDVTGDYLGVVNFVEKVYSNSEAHTRENLFTWLRAEDFSITSTGDIVAYKGLNADFTSINRGPATVDGKPVNGAVPNNVGSVVEIARSAVVADPARGCASGLHAGTYAYANGFARGALVEVHINPRDVVSVPTDCGAQKMRVARYRVVQQITAKHTAAVVSSYEDEADWEDGDL